MCLQLISPAVIISRSRQILIGAVIKSLLARRCASAVLAMVACPSVHLSVTRQCSIKTAERVELVFGIGSTLTLSCIELERNLAISKIKGASL